ncbi:AMP-binding protein [Frigidibacter albus]|uniref:3-methylmercaptopropionyl-CoA ligase n=1 Tax=Frigidibacter albus TaxID=1465486 RepID=A0A6L8VBK5_9RHOB|nr:AMP-binding protein [Frigidibacter albus]MZQ87655.1 AMP-binding protein [Frigidibacter albus]NBE29561.1 AMP-binding protein [Frigidibacter albus]GGH44109.1 AMP-dependent synthetase [Frigidibacter albus]
MNLANWLHQTGLVRPGAPALRSGTQLHATYAEFAFRSSAIGRWLGARHGIGKGDRVAIFTRNCPEYLEILYGVLWIGAAVVPINHKLHPREADWILRNAEAKLVLTGTGAVFSDDLPSPCHEIAINGAELVQAVACAQPDSYRPPVPAEDGALAWLFYTSGTTGRPKGVILTHHNLRMMATTYALDVDPVLPQDHSLYAAPMSHGAGLYNFQFVRAGACHVIPESRGFDPTEIQALGEALGNLVFFAAPTMVKRLVSHAARAGFSGEGIRTIIYGGGPMYTADLEEALRVLGPKFAQIYGQGESPMTITAMSRAMVGADDHPNAASRRASVGIAQSCVEVRVVDAQMQEAATGEVGEVVVRGDTVMAGYWRNPEATAAAVVDGWLKTGDLGRFDADGFLTLTDRSKDVIISGGTNIYPREVEEALLTHPQVFEASVIGQPHPEWGEEVVAFIVQTGEDLATADLDDWCKAQIASFKKPKRYVFVLELPKNSYGKVLKTSLRAQLADGQPAGLASGVNDDERV